MHSKCVGSDKQLAQSMKWLRRLVAMFCRDNAIYIIWSFGSKCSLKDHEKVCSYGHLSLLLWLDTPLSLLSHIQEPKLYTLQWSVSFWSKGHSRSHLSDDTISSLMLSLATRPFSQWELMQHNRKSPLKDLRVCDASISHVSVHPTPTVPMGASTSAPRYRFIIAHLLVPKRQIVHAPLYSICLLSLWRCWPLARDCLHNPYPGQMKQQVDSACSPLRRRLQ